MHAGSAAENMTRARNRENNCTIFHAIIGRHPMQHDSLRCQRQQSRCLVADLWLGATISGRCNFALFVACSAMSLRHGGDSGTWTSLPRLCVLDSADDTIHKTPVGIDEAFCRVEGSHHEHPSSEDLSRVSPEFSGYKSSLSTSDSNVTFQPPTSIGENYLP